MKMKFASALTAVVFAGPAFAEGACSIESLEGKTVELAAIMQQFAVENPVEAQELIVTFQTDFQTAMIAEDEAAACAAIDTVLEAMS